MRHGITNPLPEVHRRKFITLLGGAVAAWPLGARAQQPERPRRLGVLLAGFTDDPDYKARVAAALKELQQLGWADGRNLRVDVRFGSGSEADIRRNVGELVALAPDVILTGGTTTLAQLVRTTRTVPIVFMSAVDPVGSGFVESLARPGDAGRVHVCTRDKRIGCSSENEHPHDGFVRSDRQFRSAVHPAHIRVAKARARGLQDIRVSVS
jgi:ABC transporter substrate binding protein